MTGSASRDRARSRTTRPTRPASRTCRAACRTSDEDQRSWSATSRRVELDEILTRVIEHFRQLVAGIAMIRASDAQTRARRRRPNACSARNAKPVRRLLLATGRDRAPRCRTSSRSRAPTSATPSACSARATRCTAGRASWTWSCSRRSSTSARRSASRTCAMHNYGEPFLDRQLVEKVRYAKQKGITEVGMISNGSLITEEIARGMIDAGPRRHQHQRRRGRQGSLRVDARRPQVRQGHRQHRTLVAAPRASSARTRPKLILSFVRQNNSADEQAFIEHWRADRRQDPHHRSAQLGRHAEPRSRTCNYPCYRPWLTFTVLWDGRVSLCCADFDGRHILGDLRTSTIAEVWNSPAYRAVRRQHLESGGPDICRSCDLPKKDSPLWVSRARLDPGTGPKASASPADKLRRTSYTQIDPRRILYARQNPDGLVVSRPSAPGHGAPDGAIAGVDRAKLLLSFDRRRPGHARRAERDGPRDPRGMDAAGRHADRRTPTS